LIEEERPACTACIPNIVLLAWLPLRRGSDMGWFFNLNGSIGAASQRMQIEQVVGVNVRFKGSKSNLDFSDSCFPLNLWDDAKINNDDNKSNKVKHRRTGALLVVVNID
jgi:hypothetical protein